MQFTDKDPEETVRLGVDFANLLDTAETISSATVTARTLAGADTSTSMISGSEDIDGTVVRQLVTAGVAGQSYKISFLITTSTGQTLVEGADLRVSQRD